MPGNSLARVRRFSYPQRQLSEEAREAKLEHENSRSGFSTQITGGRRDDSIHAVTLLLKKLDSIDCVPKQDLQIHESDRWTDKFRFSFFVVTDALGSLYREIQTRRGEQIKCNVGLNL